MSIRKEPFGTAEKITITNGDLEVSVLTYGATVQAVRYKGIEVALGHPTLEDYQTKSGYLGATVGRYANRINGGRFVLNGTLYDVGCNEKGRGHLHGGKVGLSHKMWAIADLQENRLRLCHTLADGEEGYPGRLEVSVTFGVEHNTLSITYEACSDRDTVFNPTNHSYFNLNGVGNGSVENHLLAIEADAFVPVNDVLIPLGQLRPVAGTPFDFNTPKAIGAEIDQKEEQLLIGGGYDHTFAVRGTGFRKAAEAVSPATGIKMECWTDLPGVQLYSGNFLEPVYEKRHGFCLETQFYPDSPNQPQFPSATLKAGEPFRSVTSFCFK